MLSRFYVTYGALKIAVSVVEWMTSSWLLVAAAQVIPGHWPTSDLLLLPPSMLLVTCLGSSITSILGSFRVFAISRWFFVFPSPPIERGNKKGGIRMDFWLFILTWGFSPSWQGKLANQFNRHLSPESPISIIVQRKDLLLVTFSWGSLLPPYPV